MTERHSRTEPLSRRGFLGISTGLLGLSAGLLGCGGGGGGEVTGPPLSDDTRQAALDAVAEFVGTLAHTDLAADSARIEAFLKGRPEFDATTIAADGNVWAHFTDGLIFGVFNNRTLTPSRFKTPPPGRAVELPAAPRADLFFAFGQGLTSSVDEVGGLLSGSGYAPNVSPAVGVEDLKSVNESTGVFYIDAHGGLFPTAVATRGISFQSAPVSFALSTSTTVTKANLVTYAADWRNGRMIAAIATTGIQTAGAISIVPKPVWCVTEKFVTQYMRFGESSLIFINACTSYNNPFRQACFAQGASVYVGWSESIGDTPSYRVARLIFDELVGANKVVQPTPRQRPFDWPAIYNDLVKQGLDRPDSDRPTSQLLYAANQAIGKGDFGILTPSIENLTIGRATISSSLGVRGNFGSDPGAEGRVTISVAGGPETVLNVLSWQPTQITCELPTHGGDVVVTAFQRRSNPRRLTEWRGTFHYQGTGPESHVETLAMNLHILADIQSHRSEIAQPLTTLTQGAAFNTFPGATATYGNSGSHTSAQSDWTWFGGGSLTPGSFGVSPGFHYEGSLDPLAKNMKLYFSMQVPEGLTIDTKDSSGKIVETRTGSFSITTNVQLPNNQVAGKLTLAMGDSFEILGGSIQDAYKFKLDDDTATTSTSLTWATIPPTPGTQPDPGAARSVGRP